MTTGSGPSGRNARLALAPPRSAPPRRKLQVKGMNMDWTQHGGTRLSDALIAAGEPPPGVPEPVTKQAARFLPSIRCRHPGDVIRLIGSGLVLTPQVCTHLIAARAIR